MSKLLRRIKRHRRAQGRRPRSNGGWGLRAVPV
jgi:hypothetical protein